MIKSLKPRLSSFKRKIKDYFFNFSFKQRLKMQSDMTPDGLDFIKFRQSILGFFDSRQAGDIYKYYYSYDISDLEQRSRMVQFAYHLFPLFFYDQISIQYPDKIIDLVLSTQNKFGGFGVKLNSSACEDIDSIDLLCRLAHLVPSRKQEIDSSLKLAFRWVLCNQVADGGFVFRLHEPFVLWT